MNPALDALFTDLISAGVALHAARAVRRSYADALSRKGHAAWVAFYRAVFAALQRTRLPVPATLLLLLEDDLGATLFSPSEIAALRSPRSPAVAHEGTPTPRWQSFAYEGI